MEDIYQRTRTLLRDDGMGSLHEATVSVFGLGDVGACVVEGLVRSGIGNVILVNPDIVARSNLNRQLIATVPSMGQVETDAEEACLKP